MQYGVSTMIMAHLELEPALARVSQAGIGQIEISAEPPHFFPGHHDPRDVGRWLDAYGLHAPVGHGIYSHDAPNAAALEESERRRSVQLIQSCFQPLREVGVGVVVLHPTGYAKTYSAKDRQAHLDQARVSMDALAIVAGDVGVRLAWENLPHHGTDRPLHDMSELRSLVDEMPPHVGLCLDTTHATISGHDPTEQAALAGDRLFCLHLHDTDGQRDCHWVPGRGITDWPRLLRQLDDMDFQGPRTLEVASTPETAAEVIVETAAVARRWGDR